MVLIMNLDFDSSKIKQPDSFWSAAGAYIIMPFLCFTKYNKPVKPCILCAGIHPPHPLFYFYIAICIVL